MKISQQWLPADDAIALVVMAHGAGADMSHTFMQNMAALLNQQGLSVLLFNFPIWIGEQSKEKISTRSNA